MLPESLPESESTDEVVSPESGTADPSPAEGAPKSMLEAVQAAIKPVEAPAKVEAAASPAAGEPGEVKPAEAPKPKVDNYAEVPFHTHPRFRQLLKERNTFQAQLTERDEKIAKLEAVDAPRQESLQRFEKFTDAVRSSNLNAQEVNDGFAIMAAMKRDPEKALEMLTPYLEALAIATGRKLEGDLSEKVQKGTVDVETASQLQRERQARLRAETHSQGQQTAFAQREQERQTEALVQSVTSAVSSWEERQKTDPDYQKKQPLVIREIGWLMQKEGYPQNPQAAVAMAEKAKKAVEANLSALIPQRQSVRTVTGGASAATAAARPKTLLEAARLGARGEYQPSS